LIPLRTAQVDASHKEFMFATCLDGPEDENHKELLFARMSKRRSEDYGWRSLFMHASGC